MSFHDIGAAAFRLLDPETAHGVTVAALRLGLGPRTRREDDPVLAVSVAGLHLPNCIGLAAGFDCKRYKLELFAVACRQVSDFP